MADPSGTAEYLANHEMLKAIFDEMEKSATERAINARPNDDEMRRDAMHEVRAIRSVRRELALKAKGSTNPRPRSPVV